MEMSLNSKYKNAIKILRNGGVGVMPTDTLYGLVGNAFSKKTIKRIYEIKNRNKNSPLIVLISSVKDLEKSNIKINREQAKIFEKFWPGKVSIILSCKSKKFEYLHRGTNSIAFRVPAKKALIEILKKTGPLVAPSANPEGLPPAKNIKEAKKYFGDKVDFYLAGRNLNGKPSALIKIKNNGKIEKLR